MSIIRRMWSPLLEAIFCPGIPFSYRWRLLGLQPIALLTHCIQWLPNLRSDKYTICYIPLERAPGHTVRTAVFHPKARKATGPRPLHINIHGGGFLGGLPEGDARFCAQIADVTGAVVVSTSYRCAPRHVFPVAHEDVQDVAKFIIQQRADDWDIDPHLITVSGFSAGGNLALGLAQSLAGSEYVVKGCTTFYAVVDLRLPPWEKPRPHGFPKWDPLSFLQPLFDAYAGPRRLQEMHNPLMSPIIADIETLPEDMLFVIPTLDILFEEQITLVERLKQDAAMLQRFDQMHRKTTPQYNVESMIFENQIHGWLELPSAAIDEQTRVAAFNGAIRLLQRVHRKHGWELGASG